MKRTATNFSFTSSDARANDLQTSGSRRRKAVSPSESVIRNILNYSKALRVLTTTETGTINLVMN